jgi:hypothetical protein
VGKTVATQARIPRPGGKSGLEARANPRARARAKATPRKKGAASASVGLGATARGRRRDRPCARSLLLDASKRFDGFLIFFEREASIRTTYSSSSDPVIARLLDSAAGGSGRIGRVGHSAAVDLTSDAGGETSGARSERPHLGSRTSAAGSRHGEEFAVRMGEPAQ